MPCNTGQEYDRRDYDAHQKIDYLRNQLDAVTALLCALCQRVGADVMTPEMKEWYRKHQEFDKSQGR